MIRRIAAALAIVLLGAPAARAHVVSDLELTTLRKLPPEAMRRWTAEGLPDSTGNVCPDGTPGWHGIGAQAAAMPALALAAAWSDSATAERAWKSLDAAFRAQRPDGSFEPGSGRPSYAATNAREAVVWSGEAARALVALMNSGLADRFRWRYALMLPKFRRTIDGLTRAEDALERAAAADPAALLALAQAFLLADGLYHEPGFNAVGQRTLVAALALQRADGTFGGRAAHDPRSQAECLARLETVTQYFPAPSLERATDRVAAGLAKQLERRANVNTGRTNSAATTDVLLARSLGYHAARRDDAALMREVVRAMGSGRSRPRR